MLSRSSSRRRVASCSYAAFYRENRTIGRNTGRITGNTRPRFFLPGRTRVIFVPDAQWDDFEDDIVKLTKAHADCRDLNNVMDRLLRVGAMLLSFATTALVATRENTEEDEVTAPTFAECVMSGGVSLLAGLCRLLLLLLLCLLLRLHLL